MTGWRLLRYPAIASSIAPTTWSSERPLVQKGV
jgi:hypothetical protein